MTSEGKVIAAQKHGTVEDSFVMCADKTTCHVRTLAAKRHDPDWGKIAKRHCKRRLQSSMRHGGAEVIAGA